MKISNLDELYISELRDLYSAESQLQHEMPGIQKVLTSSQAANAVKLHIGQTRFQIKRLDTIFAELEEKPTGHKCRAMEGILKEISDAMEDIQAGPLLDSALIGGLSRIEHYEIAGYGAALAMAKHLGLKSHIALIKETLNEEHTTSKDLSGLMVYVLESFDLPTETPV